MGLDVQGRMILRDAEWQKALTSAQYRQRSWAGWPAGWQDGGWPDGVMDGWTDGWLDGRMNRCGGHSPL